MAAQVIRVVRYMAVPSAVVIIPVVRAGDTSDAENINATLVKPRSLPVYGNPVPVVEYEYVVKKVNAVQESITEVRKHVWKCTKSMQGTIDKVKVVYHKGEKITKDVVDYAQKEDGFYPRLVAISMAGLIGIVLGARGGVTRKLIYSGGLMTATASLCYPYQAVDIAQKSYDKSKDKVVEIYGKARNTRQSESKKESPTVAKKAESSTKDTASHDENVAVKPTTETKSSPAKVKTDLGQSTPEDKDMYTTRS